MSIKIEISKVTFYDQEKGAFVQQISKGAGERFIPKEKIVNILKNRGLRKGEFVQLQLENDVVTEIKPL